MLRVGLVALLLAACAQAGGNQPTDAAPNPMRIDAAIDANNCSQQPCSILPPCGCTGVTACDLDRTDFDGTACRSVLTPGTEVSACVEPEDCDAGYVCLGGSAYASCKKYCSFDADCGSPRGQCVLALANNGTTIQGLPKVCSSNCEPTDTTGALCPPTFKCGLFTGPNDTKLADCVLAGSRTQGQDCTVNGTSGNDTLCAKGFMCTKLTNETTFRCRRICQKAASNCGTVGATTCLSFSTPHTMGGTEYGVCN